MRRQDLSSAKNPDLHASLAAMRRAGDTARKTAVQTDTEVVLVRDGAPVQVPASRLRDEGVSGETSFTLRNRNPDVLSCIANLSNDEVFTPPEFANRMLDTLADAWAANNDGANVWADSRVTFLDPCTKSGVFLREITKRLIAGLAVELPDLQERVDHILTKQVFGIAITRLTALLARRSLYCSKNATGEHSIATKLDDDRGNVWFERIAHQWDGTKCKWCGAPHSIFDRPDDQENHAYEFIHTDDAQSLVSRTFGKNMNFDVIIDNPPYQLASDGGTRDVPIYQHFVQQAKALQPRYLSMVIPARWMASGLGLSEFRRSMLSDCHNRELVDYPAASEVFPGVEIKAGVCYFLWDSSHDGLCKVTTVRGDEEEGPVLRDLSEYDVLVRDARAVDILHRVASHNEPSINTILVRDKEFGWTSNFDGFHANRQPGDVPVHYIRKMKRGVGYIDRSKIAKSKHLGSRLIHSQNASAVASATPDRKLSASLS